MYRPAVPNPEHDQADRKTKQSEFRNELVPAYNLESPESNIGVLRNAGTHHANGLRRVVDEVAGLVTALPVNGTARTAFGAPVDAALHIRLHGGCYAVEVLAIDGSIAPNLEDAYAADIGA